MTLAETIKKYGLTEQKRTCFGDLYPNGATHYHGEKDTEKAKYIYHLDNQFSKDLDNGKTFYLTIERYSKTATVWSDLFNAFIPRKTTKHYEIINA